METDRPDFTDELIAGRRAGPPGRTPGDMPPWMAALVYRIDTASRVAGRIICWMLVPLMLAMVYEVVARKLFIAPTMWAYDISRMLCGAMFMLGAGYALSKGVHIRADFLYRNWPARRQGMVDAALYVLFYFPGAHLLRVGLVRLRRRRVDPRRAQHGHRVDGAARPPSHRDAGGGGAPSRPGCLRAPEERPRHSHQPLAAMSSELIGALMIAVMLLAIFVGFPISFTLIFLGLAFGYWGFGDLVFYLMTLQFNSVMLEQTLAAVPLFVFMGIMMEQAGLMERLFRSVQLMLASTRGSLYIAVLFVSTIFAAATGIVGASVTILGIMAAKTMNRSGYDVRLAAGTITAGGTLGILIPPSIMLVVLGPVLEVPVTDLFAAAIVPGLLLAFLYTAYSLVRCWLNPELGPPLPKEEHPESLRIVLREFSQGLVPPAALVGFALGSILFGWATPTEGAACGAFGSLLLSAAYGKLNSKRFTDALIKTLEISVLILFLVAASNFFGAVFSRLGTPGMLTNMLLDWELTQIQVLLIVMALIFLLGWPLEWVPIVLIIVPILIPLLDKMGVNLTWFGILVAVNLQTAWLSPPVALSAYFLKGAVPAWDLKDIYIGMMQFMVIQLIGLAAVLTFPQLALWLPSLIYG